MKERDTIKSKTIYVSNNLHIVMKHLDYLERIVSLVLYSGYIKDERPLSILIIAPAESGKTDCVLQFSDNNGVAVVTDATPYGIIRDFFDDIQKGRLKHLIIPDLTIPLSDNMVRLKFISFLTALIEEGVLNISKYYRSALPMKDAVKARCGIITCLVPEVMKDRRRKWASIGFLSRALPFTYAYTKDAVQSILGYIQNGEHLFNKKIMIDFPEEAVDVKLDAKYAVELTPAVKVLAEATSVYGFRYQRQYQTLLKCCALANNRNEVNSSDVEEIRKIIMFLNFEYSPIKIVSPQGD